jgi:TRAP-type C4-dicarboxylate transport system permease small subunit
MTAFAASLTRLLAPLSRAALWIASLGLVLMTLFVAWQVFGRYILNNSPSWTEPGSLLLMSWFILLGSAVGVREGDHLGFEIGLHYASPPIRLAMRTITFSLMIVFGIAMAVYGSQLTASTWRAKMAGVGLPQGMDYVPLVVGGVLIALFSLEKLAQLYAGRESVKAAPASRIE